MEQRVTVWDRVCRIAVSQQASTVWVASGEWLGRVIETRARNPTAAVNLWQDQARAAGDGRPLQPRLDAAVRELVEQGGTDVAIANFQRDADEAFLRAGTVSLPEKRRRLAHALRA